MKVCLITGEFPPMQGGMGDFTSEVGKALAKLGAEVSVITSVKGQGHGISESLAVHPLIVSWGWRSWGPILRALKRESPHVVNIQYQAAAYGMHPAINFLPLRLHFFKNKPKVVVTFHDLKTPYLFPKAGSLRWWVILALVRWSDAVIVTNLEDLLRLRDAAPHPPYPQAHLIPIGSNIAPHLPPGYSRDAWRAKWGVRPEGILLSYFGFLNESKGGETLIRALARLVKMGRDVHLLMVGGKVGSSDPTNLAYARKVEALIEELGLAGRILWTGYTEANEVSANLVASDICVLPYRDGASFRRGSFMAALAHGLPIISTRPRVVLPELEDGQNLALVPPDAPDALAEKIMALADSPSLRARLAQGAEELGRAFSWESIAEKTLTLFRHLKN
ncbi:MAG: glycosyltransferase [Anaerolineae bacterium]